MKQTLLSTNQTAYMYKAVLQNEIEEEPILLILRKNILDEYILEIEN